MKLKKIFLLILCLILSLTVLAGCKDKTGGEPTPAPSAQATTTENQNTQKREAEFSVLKPGDEYKIYHWFQAEGTDAFSGDDVISTYRAGQVTMLKDKYDVTVTFVPFIADWFETVRSSAYSGAPVADGMHAGGPHVLADHYYYNNIPASCLESLDDYGIDFTDDQYFQTEAQKIYGTFDGKLYYFINQYVGSKLIEEQQIVFVNYDLLKTGGYNKEDLLTWVQNGEWTWDKFKEVAIRCTVSDGTYWGVGRSGVVDNLLASNNGTLVQEEEVDGVKIDRFAADSDECVQMFDFFKTLYDNGAVAPADVSGGDTEVQAAFAAGKLTFMFNYFNRTAALQENNPEMDYGYVLVPKGPKATDYVSVKNWFDPFCAFKGSKNTAGTMKVMKEIYAPMFAKDSQEAKDLYESEVSKFVKDDQSKIMCDMSRDRVLYTKTATYSYVMDGINNPGKVDSILKGEVTPKAYLDSIVDQMNGIINQVLRIG